MTLPEIEPRSHRPLANTLIIMPMFRTVFIRIHKYVLVARNMHILFYKQAERGKNWKKMVGMTRSGIERRSPWLLVNTITTVPMSGIIPIRIYKCLNS